MNNNFLAGIMASMSDADKQKLGTVGTKINTDGEHAVTIKEFFVGEYDGQPNVQIKFETADGKASEWIGSLTSEVQAKEDGTLTREAYTYSGQPLVNPKVGDRCDNLATVGKIENLCKILGTTIDEASAGVTMGAVKSFGKAIEAPIYSTLIGKELVIITSFEVSLDKDKKKVWRNQKISGTYFFNSDRLSLLEIKNGKTEPVAINEAIKLAKKPKEQYADIGYGIKFSDQKNPLCIQELKLLGQAGTVPTKEPASGAASGASADDDDEAF